MTVTGSQALIRPINPSRPRHDGIRVLRRAETAPPGPLARPCRFGPRARSRVAAACACAGAASALGRILTPGRAGPGLRWCEFRSTRGTGALGRARGGPRRINWTRWRHRVRVLRRWHAILDGGPRAPCRARTAHRSPQRQPGPRTLGRFDRRPARPGPPPVLVVAPSPPPPRPLRAARPAARFDRGRCAAVGACSGGGAGAPATRPQAGSARRSARCPAAALASAAAAEGGHGRTGPGLPAGPSHVGVTSESHPSQF